MDKDKGFIKLFREIQENDLWLCDDPFSVRDAFIDLMLMANYETKKTLYRGQYLTIRRGQVYTSIRKLSERWHWSRSKVERYLAVLEDMGMVKNTHETHYGTLLTIVNYEKFQNRRDTNRDSDVTEKRQRKDGEQPLLKKDKKDKKEKNIYAPSEPSVDDEEGWEYVQL